MKVIRATAKTEKKSSNISVYHEYDIQGETYHIGFNEKKKEVELVALSLSNDWKG